MLSLVNAQAVNIIIVCDERFVTSAYTHTQNDNVFCASRSTVASPSPRPSRLAPQRKGSIETDTVETFHKWRAGNRQHYVSNKYYCCFVLHVNQSHVKAEPKVKFTCCVHIKIENCKAFLYNMFSFKSQNVISLLNICMAKRFNVVT